MLQVQIIEIDRRVSRMVAISCYQSAGRELKAADVSKSLGLPAELGGNWFDADHWVSTMGGLCLLLGFNIYHTKRFQRRINLRQCAKLPAELSEQKPISWLIKKRAKYLSPKRRTCSDSLIHIRRRNSLDQDSHNRFIRLNRVNLHQPLSVLKASHLNGPSWEICGSLHSIRKMYWMWIVSTRECILEIKSSSNVLGHPVIALPVRWWSGECECVCVEFTWPGELLSDLQCVRVLNAPIFIYISGEVEIKFLIKFEIKFSCFKRFATSFRSQLFYLLYPMDFCAAPLCGLTAVSGLAISLLVF